MIEFDLFYWKDIEYALKYKLYLQIKYQSLELWRKWYDRSAKNCIYWKTIKQYLFLRFSIKIWTAEFKNHEFKYESWIKD